MCILLRHVNSSHFPLGHPHPPCHVLADLWLTPRLDGTTESRQSTLELCSAMWLMSACHVRGTAPQMRRAALQSDNDGGNTRRMFIFGLGYTGLAVANQLQKRGWCAASSPPC